MRRIAKTLIFPLIVIGVFLVFACSCEEDIDYEIEPSSDFMVDQEGNVYKTVTIGTQTWMAENLRTTIYNDGTAIPNVTDPGEWATLTTGAYCTYDNSIDTVVHYGRLYNWYAIDTGKFAPKGWHVPSDAEWTELTDYLGGESVAGGKLKDLDSAYWKAPNTGGTNKTGFTALPGGYRGNGGTFADCEVGGSWWTATEYDTGSAWPRHMYYNSRSVGRFSSSKELGFSVRFVKD